MTGEGGDVIHVGFEDLSEVWQQLWGWPLICCQNKKKRGEKGETKGEGGWYLVRAFSSRMHRLQSNQIHVRAQNRIVRVHPELLQ